MSVRHNQSHPEAAVVDRPGSARLESAVSVWLDHVAVITINLEQSLDFYSRVIGLRIHVSEEDPLRRGHRRAMLLDSQGRDVLELIEMTEFKHRTVAGRGSVHHMGFRLPDDDWTELKNRLDAANHPYEMRDDKLFVKDVDGLLLEISRF